MEMSVRNDWVSNVEIAMALELPQKAAVSMHGLT